jgi:chloride channel protein, CIC family
MEGGKTRWREVALIVGAALVVGAVSAVGVRLFKRMIALAESLAFGWLGALIEQVGLWPVLLVPVLGGLVVGLTLHLFSIPEEPGHGVTEVIEAVTLHTREFPYHQMPVKVSVAAISLGSGAAMGPEDPSVELGGSVGAFFGRLTGMSSAMVQRLVAAGGAAGIAAAFQAPVTAILFSKEVISVPLRSHTMLGVIVAASVGMGVSRLLAPETPLDVPAYTVISVWEALLCIGLGAIAGSLAALHIRLLYTLEHFFIGWKTPPRWLKPAIGGLLIGLVGLVLPQTLGIGYETVEAVAAGEIPGLGMLVALMIGKLILTPVSFGSGFLGGFFAPSFFIGATMGGAYGLAAQSLWPALNLTPATFAVVGMAAFLAGTVRAPLAATSLLVELAGHPALLPLLLVGAFSSAWVGQCLEKHSVYTYGLAHPAQREHGLIDEDENLPDAHPEENQRAIDDQDE